MTDARALIRRVTSGDRKAADAFVLLYSPFVYSVLHRSGLPKSLIDDAHQQVFLKLWDDEFQRLRMLRDPGRFLSYLGTLTRRTGLDLLRASPKESPTDGELRIVSDEPSPERVAEIAEERARLLRAATRLKGRDRRLFALRYVRELKPRQIAERLDMTENAVYVALHRLEKKLARLLRDDPDAPGSGPARPRAPKRPGP